MLVAVKMLKPPAAPVAPVVEQLRAAGVNAVFCRTDGLFTAPVFCDPDAVKKDPGLMGVGSLGNPSKAEGADWLAFVCPARRNYRKARIAAITRQLRELQADGLSLDFIRYYVYWEKIAPGRTGDSIERFCFCDYCLGLMATELALRFPAALIEDPAGQSGLGARHGPGTAPSDGHCHVYCGAGVAVLGCRQE